MVPKDTTELCLKFRGYMRPFDAPNYPEVALAGLQHFEQEGMMCYPIHIGPETIYKFVLLQPVEKEGHFLQFKAKSDGVTHEIPLYYWEKDQDKRNETMRKNGKGGFDAED